MLHKRIIALTLFCLYFLLSSCHKNSHEPVPVFADLPVVQEISVKYLLPDSLNHLDLLKVETDRNGNTKVLTSSGLYVPSNGKLFFPGTLVKDISYSPVVNKKLLDFGLYQNQFVYLDDRQVFSNSWAGSFQENHNLAHPACFATGKDFRTAIGGNQPSILISPGAKNPEKMAVDSVSKILYSEKNGCFYLLNPDGIYSSDDSHQLKIQIKKKGITCFNILSDNRIAVGANHGYFIFPDTTLYTKLPADSITCIHQSENKLWFGTTNGAFCMDENGRTRYYAGGRWLADNHVTDIKNGPHNSVYILTHKGLSEIIFQKYTLEEKASFFEKQVRRKNIRYGFNCPAVSLKNGYAGPVLTNQPSDNLWTSMYLVGQLYRFKVTGDPEAEQNVKESFDAMERLFTVTGTKGLFARSFERDHKTVNNKTSGWQQREYYSGSPALVWAKAADLPDWAWRATASSDQAVGQMFALTSILELSDDVSLKKRALTCLSNLATHILENNLYIIDNDGEPTLWGKWNPEYVNSFPTCVGDRKLYSVNIIAFLQAAYHFTGKTAFRDKVTELIEKHGYLKNIMKPVSEIHYSDSTQLSKILSAEWNHSDDEMYFLTYQSLVKYALTPELKASYLMAITDHWESEKPEKNALWNLIFYAATGNRDFDPTGTVDFLTQYPLDLRVWDVSNSARKDLELLPENFRHQTTAQLLPLGEIPLFRHNLNIFRLDSSGDGKTLISAGDVWLLPYWMARYLKVISEGKPGNEKITDKILDNNLY